MKPAVHTVKHKGPGLLLLCVILLFLGGCSDAKQGLPGGAAPAVIEVWHTLTGAEAEVLEKQSKRIMVERPEVLLRLKHIPQEKIVEQTYLAQAGGEGPELFLTSEAILHQLYQKGALSPLIAKAEAFPGLTAAFQHGGQVFAQPLAADIPLFYYRTDLAQPPASWKGLADSKGSIALPALEMSLLSAWWRTQGGQLLNNGYPNMDSSENQLFLQQLLTWRDNRQMLISPVAWEDFLSGRAAYTLSWAAQAQGLGQTIPWVTLPLSQLSSGKGDGLPGRILGLANTSIKKSAALDSIIRIVEEEFAKPELQYALSQAGKRFPGNPTFYERPEAQTPILKQVRSGLTQAWVLPAGAPERKLIPLQEQAWQKAWTGSTPQEALAQAQFEGVKAMSP